MVCSDDQRRIQSLREFGRCLNAKRRQNMFGYRLVALGCNKPPCLTQQPATSGERKNHLPGILCYRSSSNFFG